MKNTSGRRICDDIHNVREASEVKKLKRDEFGVVPLYCYFDTKERGFFADRLSVNCLKKGVPRRLS